MFSCTEFDKGDFLLEYRGDLISKEENERGKEYIMMHLKFSCLSFATTENSAGMYKCLMYMLIDN